jgi:hypothetical protein
MVSSRPVARGRLPLFPLVLVTLAASACAGRPPRLVPPAAGVEAVDGYGSASIAGTEAVLKGKFSFVFRRPDLGRVDGLDPIGRTVFLIVFRGGRAWFALPDRKVYAEDDAAVMMERFLGIALVPDEVVGLLAGSWESAAPGGLGGKGWSLERDAQGRLARGRRGDYAFAVRSYFPGDAVPREIGLEGPGASGRVKVLKLGFDPAPRPEAFEAAFTRAYAPRTWAEILELLER